MHTFTRCCILHACQIKGLESVFGIEGEAAGAVNGDIFRRSRLLNFFRFSARLFGGDLFQPAAVEFPRRCVCFQERVIFVEIFSVQFLVTVPGAAVLPCVIANIGKDLHGVRIVHPFPFGAKAIAVSVPDTGRIP